MNQTILNLADATALVKAGRILLLAGDEALLRQLPQGRWIAGTIPYFITPDQGGLMSRDMVFVTDISEVVNSISIAQYDKDTLSRVYAEGPEHGFSFIIMPAACEAHLSFALNAPSYEDFGVRPLIGWISGVHLSDLGKVTPKVFNGSTGEALEEGAMVLQASLDKNKVAEIGILNLFEQGDGDVLTFPVSGFSVSDVLVNGEKRSLAGYITANKLDTRLPLVADYYGVMVNSSFQAVAEPPGEVSFYAPVFTGVRYKHAKPLEDYVAAFNSRVGQECPEGCNRIIFSCNCILNYLYSGLEGKTTEPFFGPMTFGEIAYQLLNQTMVFLDIYDA